MKFKNTPDFSHEQADRIGILVTNLGTPEAPTTSALRRYLAQFLSDPRVVEVPRVIWKMVLHGVILRIRPPRSAKAYAGVWTAEGSPLMVHTEAQAKALKAVFHAEGVEVAFAMRYGSPAIDDVIQQLVDKGVRKLVVLPLYPQYSASTSASTFDAIAADFTRRRWLPDFRFIAQYADHPAYIQALVSSIQQFWATHGRTEKLVFSYHGVPQKYLHRGDPYHCQCLKTTRLVAQELGLNDSEYLTTFQSRFGREPWLQPYTDHTLKSLASEGVKSVQVICPGFSADCLETIEEIGEENRDYFLEAGGERFEYIPALNASEEHIAALATILRENLQGWAVEPKEAYAERARLANACPHNI